MGPGSNGPGPGPPLFPYPPWHLCRSTRATSVEALLSLFRPGPCMVTEKLRSGPCMFPCRPVHPCSHIWWSSMMIIYIIYDHHIRSSYMIIYADHIWWLNMMIIYDHHIWSSYMMIISDDHIWSAYMMIMYDDHIWSSYIMIIITRTPSE